MIFVPVMDLIAFLHLSSIGVFCPHLVGVLFVGVALARDIHERCVNDGNGIGDDVRFLNMLNPRNRMKLLRSFT